ncbi:MAG TPA: PD-(D/E)XK nuclease family protein [Allocoleopsis sp.]
MSKLKFNKKKHLYTIDNIELKSVTTYISELFEPFDAKVVAKKLASFPINKQQKKGVRYWLKKWKKTQEDGTLIHNEIDAYIKSDGNSEMSLPKSISAERFIKINDLLNKSLQSEVQIYSLKLKLAGTVDAIYYNSDGTYTLIDWKTSEKIEKESYKNRKGIHNATKHIPDSNYWHYAIQLNLYKKILESEYNMKVSELLLIHLQDTSCYVYSIPLMEDIIKKLEEDLK